MGVKTKLKFDHRGPSSSKLKLVWWWVGGMREMIATTVQILIDSIVLLVYHFIEIFIVVEIRTCQ